MKIPGVVDYALSTFFMKLIVYTFVSWLPFYILNMTSYSTEQSSGYMSMVFDFAGMAGNIFAGLIADKTNCGAVVSVVMLTVGAACTYLYFLYAKLSMHINIALLMLVGVFINGPFYLTVTSVPVNLATNPDLRGNVKATSTVTAIIDGTGSVGAAIGPFITGYIMTTGWANVVYMLIVACLCASIFLLRLAYRELKAL